MFERYATFFPIKQHLRGLIEHSMTDTALVKIEV